MRGDAVIVCAECHATSRCSRSGLVACTYAASAVTPLHGVRRRPRRVPNSQTVLPIPRRQRLAARPAARAPRLLCVRRPRRRLAQLRRRLATVSEDAAARAQIANSFPDYPLATVRCPAGRSRHTSVVRPSPAASLGVVARGVVISLCGTPHRVARAADRRFAKMRPALLRRSTASEDARGACQIRKPFSRFSAGVASLPGRPPAPHVFFPSLARGGGVHRCGGVVVPRRGVRRCPRRVPKSQTVLPIIRLQRFAARWADLALAKMRLLHHAAASEDARSLCLIFQTFHPVRHSQRFAARPPDLAPRLLCVRRPRRNGALLHAML